MEWWQIVQGICMCTGGLFVGFLVFTTCLSGEWQEKILNWMWKERGTDEEPEYKMDAADKKFHEALNNGDLWKLKTTNKLV